MNTQSQLLEKKNKPELNLYSSIQDQKSIKELEYLNKTI